MDRLDSVRFRRHVKKKKWSLVTLSLRCSLSHLARGIFHGTSQAEGGRGRDAVDEFQKQLKWLI